ncbi:hypothetical protein [Chitinophaga qingshengii]|uniref:Uncharacterized protein n=1 Tax=Chitinophaga qingshengii TaxID=1569794 RepID=A0ABR7TL57_9BACT|nr:hypothetical protein [Chitinophaga qingshengii]MBC9931204.1 hypothetical protein [Chitinophaga qingshengii]
MLEQEKAQFLQQSQKRSRYFSIFLVVLPIAGVAFFLFNTFPAAPRSSDAGGYATFTYESQLRDCIIYAAVMFFLVSLISVASWAWKRAFFNRFHEVIMGMSVADFNTMRHLNDSLPAYNMNRLMPPYLVNNQVLYVFKAFRTLTIHFSEITEMGVCLNYVRGGTNDQVYIKTHDDRFYFHIAGGRQYTENLERLVQQIQPPVPVIRYQGSIGVLRGALRRNN